MSTSHEEWPDTVNTILVDHEQRIGDLEKQIRAAVHIYGAGTPWPDIAKLQIEELQFTVATQTAEINRLLDRLAYIETLVHRYIDSGDDGK